MDFGRYEILEERARGACGIVYQARDRELDRIVALKALRQDDSGPLSRERFLREARLAASLDHPNIVKILETGEHEGRLFYTMPLLEGELLRGPLPPAEACRLLERVARAAAHAHSRGIVHRDLKPSNIVVCSGEPVVTDFGVARGPGDPRLTETGELLGTPAYMAPEQARGDSREADGRADVYSIGVMLHELLSGRLPHSAPSFLELSSKILNDPAPDLEGFDPALRNLVRRCLEKNPASRPDAVALARSLARWLPRRPSRWPAALPILLAAAAAALWGAAPSDRPPPSMIRIGEIWIDREEAPPRAGGYSYLDAVAYCLRAGKRLPTEPEWEAGAAEGCRDMADHLAEWTATEGRPGRDTRVVRGGHWLSPQDRRTIRERQELPVTKRSPTLGFRCASASPP
ncbi:MAG TPA: protein kinase [Planctomycetota bacterium]|nr:protein kinase [Planctomycetota bacterium]